MTHILRTEQETYEDAWAIPEYATNSRGAQMVPTFTQFATPPKTVLDVGCGSGRGTQALVDAKFSVVACDLMDARIMAKDVPFFETTVWKPLMPLAYLAGLTGPPFAGTTFDWVFCTEVLEHLPTQFAMLAVQNMFAVAKEGIFVSVGLHEDNFGVWVGKPLHQTIQPFSWWRDSFRELCLVEDARDLINDALFVLRPMDWRAS